MNVTVGRKYKGEKKDSLTIREHECYTLVLCGNDNNEINAEAELKEFYSEKNFLKRTNTNDWETDGYGITVDLSLHLKVNNQFNVSLDIKDLYSKYKFKNSL